MATKKSSKKESSDRSKFSIELGHSDLTDAEINNLQNEVTKNIVDTVQKNAGAVERDAYVKILYVKLTHTKSVRH
jgi:predicted transcriptional regulator